MERWEVITEIGLRAKVNGWGLTAKHALFAAQERFREEGPDAFELDAPSLTGDPEWDQLSKAYVAELWIQVERTWLWVELEILPDKTVIFRPGAAGMMQGHIHERTAQCGAGMASRLESRGLGRD